MSVETASRREPLLIDRLLTKMRSRAHWSAGTASHIPRLTNARRFVFDTDASETMARIGLNLPDQIAEQMRFAVVPYPLTWVEIDARAHYMKITEGTEERRSSVETADRRLGWLFVGNVAYSYAQGPDGDTTMGPIVFDLHTHWSEHEQQAFCKRTGLTLELLDGCLWGSSTQNPKVREPSFGYRAALRAAHRLRVVPAANDPQWTPAAFRHFLLSSAGELRMVLAALLLLNRPAKPARYVAVPPGRGWIGNKHKPYVGYSLISLDVGAGPPLLPLHRDPGHGSPHRHHEVRPHYAHRWTPLARGCDHAYVRLADYPPDAESDASKLCRWECQKCGTMRFRRRAHSRGDALLGVSVQTHQVTDSRRAA